METLKVGDFQSQLNEATGAIVLLNGTEKLSIQTGEAQLAKTAIKFAASLLNSPVLPNVIRFSPFTVKFTEDGGAQLLHAGVGHAGGSGISFSKATWEDLMKLIDMSVHRVADYLKIRGGPRAGVSSVRMPDPLI
jgi:hypothetical protein